MALNSKPGQAEKFGKPSVLSVSPIMSEDRGRTLERKGPGYSRWTDAEKISVPGLPLFLPDVLDDEQLEALLLRYRIDEIGFKLAQNQLDVDLRARYVPIQSESMSMSGARAVCNAGKNSKSESAPM